MDNEDNIFEFQNTPLSLALLRTYNRLYSIAKKRFTYKFFVGIIGPCIISIITVYVKSYTLFAILAFITVLMLIAIQLLELSITDMREKGAKVQQAFDMFLFEIVCSNNYKFSHLLRDLESRELIIKYDDKEYSSLKNWYSDYSSLSKPKQVFYCQAENVRYDKALRQRYTYFHIIVCISVFVLFCLTALVGNSTFVQIISISSYFSPVLSFYLSLFYSLKKENDRLIDVKNTYCDLGEKINQIDDEQILCETSDLQYFIFEHRRNATLIPDWFYRIFKSKQQAEEDSLASNISNQNKEDKR